MECMYVFIPSPVRAGRLVICLKLIIYATHMGSFAHPAHYFAVAGENDDFVIAAINFPLHKSFLSFFVLPILVLRQPDFKYADKRKF